MSLFNDFEFETSTPEIRKLQKINKQITESLETDLHYVKELSELSHFIQEELTINFDESCGTVQEFLKQIRILDTRFLIIREFFHTQDECLPVQLLWGLEVEDLFHFPVYIAMKPEFINELSQNLIELLFSEYSMKFNVIISLLRPVFISSNLLDPIMYCPSDKLLSTFQKMYVERELSGSSSCETNLLQRLTKEPFMLLSTLILFVKKILKLILVHKSENETLPKITDAINKQNTDWTYNKISSHVTIFIKQVLDCLTFESIIEMIHSTLMEDDHEFNWKWYLITISTLIVNYPQSADTLKKFLDQWLKEAVTKKSKRNLAAVILTVRQCCAESVPPFTSYASWYCQLDNHLETPAEFKFLIEFFSQIVPHEQSLCLKIHINKVPSVPAGAYAAISDYISLAKTRLTDLNETTDYIGLFGEYKTSEKEGRESDIAKVIGHFKETGEIMKTVIEASVFRRNYYERVFITDLLQPEVDKENPRYKFIEKLFSVGKCPNAMYMDWVIRSNNERQLQKERSEIEIIEFFDTEDWGIN